MNASGPKERTIVLTGCTRGLGRELVDRFLERGHIVLGCGRSAQNVHGLADRHGAPHDFTSLDASERAAVETWAQRLLAEHSTPDLLINNAALMNTPAPLWEVPAGEFELHAAVPRTSKSWDRQLATGQSSTLNWTTIYRHPSEGEPVTTWIEFGCSELDVDVFGNEFNDEDMDTLYRTAVESVREGTKSNYITLSNNRPDRNRSSDPAGPDFLPTVCSYLMSAIFPTTVSPRALAW